MRFALSDDQAALRAAVRGFLDEHAPMPEVRAMAYDGEGPGDLWTRMAGELGVTGVGLPEEYGGTGENFVDLAVVMRELGRALAPVPFLSSTVLAARLLLESGDRAAAERWLPALAAGDLVATAALVETSGDWSFGDLATAARRSGGRWVLDGGKSFVTDGAAAGLLLVLARAAEGPTLFAVRPGDEGVGAERLDALDPTRPLAAVTLAGAPGELIGAPGGALPVAARALAAGAVALACEQAGGAERCLEMAVEYAGVRVQFDRPIGSFQSIKHLLADRLVDNRAVAAAAYHAAWSVDHLPGELPARASLCKAFASDAYFAAATANVQVHGGIGFTWEHDAHLHLRRAVAGKALLGSPREHRERIAAHVLDAPGGE